MDCWRRLLNYQFFVMLRSPSSSSLLEGSSMNLEAQGIIFCTTFQLPFHVFYINMSCTALLIWSDHPPLSMEAFEFLHCFSISFSWTMRGWFLHLRVLCEIFIASVLLSQTQTSQTRIQIAAQTLILAGLVWSYKSFSFLTLLWTWQSSPCVSGY